MQAERYFGTYARFNTLSKKDAAILLGADNPIGDVFEIVFQTDNGVSTAWMKNLSLIHIYYQRSRAADNARGFGSGSSAEIFYDCGKKMCIRDRHRAAWRARRRSRPSTRAT